MGLCGTAGRGGTKFSGRGPIKISWVCVCVWGGGGGGGGAIQIKHHIPAASALSSKLRAVCIRWTGLGTGLTESCARHF